MFAEPAPTISAISRFPSHATPLTVVTGLSGSGKSSLAFDTIYAEGQRRYVETTFRLRPSVQLDQMEHPDVRSIGSLSPAIAIEQKTTSRSPRSTVGTITEIYDYLRLLYASVGQPHCPQLPSPHLATDSRPDHWRKSSIAAATNPAGAHHRPCSHRPRPQRRVPRGARWTSIKKASASASMAKCEIEEGMRLEKRKNHTVEAIVDRIILKPSTDSGGPLYDTVSSWRG